jgi:hypothetical protein
MSLEPPQVSPTHRLARHIEVKRDKGDPSVRVYIDGDLVPFFATGDGIKVEAPFGRPGAVTITLTAEKITVDDQYLVGQGEELGLDHDHPDDKPDERVMPDKVLCLTTPGCILDGPEHVGPCL